MTNKRICKRKVLSNSLNTMKRPMMTNINRNKSTTMLR